MLLQLPTLVPRNQVKVARSRLRKGSGVTLAARFEILKLSVSVLRYGSGRQESLNHDNHELLLPAIERQVRD